ncbi:DMT family transporter [Geminicoccus roseus]|uniref:DMT family transporter n=1 Tax=Geminicoccus roseus TaxID=404900 RepID=UPI00146F9879|nr:DMT family transporter [Geminicoccus roseus]
MDAVPGRIAGIGFALCGILIFTVVFAAGKLTGGEVPLPQLVTLRLLGALPVLLVWRLLVRGRVPLLTRAPGWSIARVVCGYGGLMCALEAGVRLPLAQASTLGLLEGVLAVLLAGLFLHERIGRRHALAAVIGLGGAIVAAQPWRIDWQVSLGVPIALLSALMFALEAVVIKKLVEVDEAWTVIFTVHVLGLLVLAVPALMVWQPLESGTALFILALGPLGIVGQFVNVRAWRALPVSVIGPLTYSWVLFASLLGFVAFGELPGIWTIVGAAFILLGGVLLARDER